MLIGKSQAISNMAMNAASAYFEVVADAIKSPTDYGAVTDADWQAVATTMLDQGSPQHYVDVLAAQDVNNADLCPALIAFMQAMITTSGDAGRRVRSSFVTQTAGS